MGQAIGEILGLAVGIAVSPVQIIAVILILFSVRAAAGGTAFAAGWFAGVTAVVVIVLLIAQSQDLDASSGEPATWVSLLKAALGALLLFAGIRKFASRPAAGEDAPLPAWLESVERLTPLKALGVGTVLPVVNVKILVLAATAAISIAQANLSGGEDVVVVIVFVLISCSTVAAPVVMYRVMGERAQPVLDSMKAWLTQNNVAVIAVLFMVFGAVIFGQGIGPLIGD